jgi:hypothetical protein
MSITTRFNRTEPQLTRTRQGSDLGAHRSSARRRLEQTDNCRVTHNAGNVAVPQRPRAETPDRASRLASQGRVLSGSRTHGSTCGAWHRSCRKRSGHARASQASRRRQGSRPGPLWHENTPGTTSRRQVKGVVAEHKSPWDLSGPLQR